MSTTELPWLKSSYSGTQGDSCVEIAITDQAVHIRDSKDANGPHLTITRDEWTHFIRFAARS